MTQRRNSCTAVLFLAGILWAAVFLCLGALPKAAGFLEASKPAVTVRQLASPSEGFLPSQPADAPHVQAPSHVIRSPGSPVAHLLREVSTACGAYLSGDSALSDQVDAALNEQLDRDHTFIQIYGGAQRLLGRRVVDDVERKYTVVKLTDYFLTFADPEGTPTDMTVRAAEMAGFAQRLAEEEEIPLLYVQAPAKTDVAPLPDGIRNCAGEEADQFLSLLEAAGVDTLDLRPAFREAAEEDQASALELFFHTDHHWTPAGAFLGYQLLCEKLAQDYDFQIDEAFTDAASFHRYTFEDVFLGSQGKRVGPLYAGVDDIEIWSPKTATDFHYTATSEGIDREGPFALSLLFPELLAETGLYDTNPYVIYSGGDYFLARAVNRQKADGPRVLILRDSYGCAIAPFLALQCGEVMTMDPRLFNGDQDELMGSIQWLAPDLIIVLNTTSSLEVDTLYPYLPTARASALAAQEGEE